MEKVYVIYLLLMHLKYVSIWGGGNYSNVQTELEDLDDNKFDKTGGTMTGNLIIDSHNGTSSQIGSTELLIGNGTAEGSEGNSQGVIRLYSNTQYRAVLTAPNLTLGRAITFPDKQGQLLVDSPETITTGFSSPNIDTSAVKVVRNGRFVTVYITNATAEVAISNKNAILYGIPRPIGQVTASVMTWDDASSAYKESGVFYINYSENTGTMRSAFDIAQGRKINASFSYISYS